MPVAHALLTEPEKAENWGMKMKRPSVEQNVGVLKRTQVGVPAAEVIRNAWISDQTFYRWKKQYVCWSLTRSGS